MATWAAGPAPAAMDWSLAGQLIALCDIYEAMTHPRPWREPVIPHQALKSLLRKDGATFSPKVFKLFLERLSLFPVGSYVLLSSGQIARVLRSTPPMPTRPIVELRADVETGQRIEPRLMNLAENPMIYIRQAVDETALVLKDKRLRLQLAADRYWVQ